MSQGSQKHTENAQDSLQNVQTFWNSESCGERYAEGSETLDYYTSHARQRYLLEPCIPEFADFAHYAGQDVLEVGVGMGADHSMIAQAGPRSLTGIDLTERAITHTQDRLRALNLQSTLKVDNAQDLSFDSNSFDAVYSWGVIHHAPDTKACFDEIWRVLRPGGEARIMIYHTHSPTGWMLWVRYSLMKFRLLSMAEIYDRYLESPGTKAYTVEEAKTHLADKFTSTECKVILNFGDLLEGDVGQRHRGPLLSVAKKIFPRRLITALSKRYPIGLYLLITARK